MINGRFYFPRRNSGQTLTKNLLISGQIISGHSVQQSLFSSRTGLFNLFFSPQLADTINSFEVTLAAREDECKKQFVKCFLNANDFRHIEILLSSSFFTVSIFQSTVGQTFLDLKTIFNWNFKFIATFMVQSFAYKWIWSHLLKKSLMKNFTFCAVSITTLRF